MPHHVHMPQLLVERAIEPKSRSDQERLSTALTELAPEDPAFRVEIDSESSQIILKGTSETHLEDKIDILERSYAINVNVGAPMAAHFERPTRRVEVEYTYKKAYGPKGEFAAVKLLVEPNEPGNGYEFKSTAAVDAVPDEYIPGVEKGLASVLSSGVVAGFPVTDVRVELTDGKHHSIDSCNRAFEIATRAAFRDALQKAHSVLLEPIMKVGIEAPSDFGDAVISDLTSRRGNILGQQVHGDTIAISATAPLMRMFGYLNDLHAMSLGRATFTMQFDHYAPAPSSSDDVPPFRPALGMRA